MSIFDFVVRKERVVKLESNFTHTESNSKKQETVVMIFNRRICNEFVVGPKCRNFLLTAFSISAHKTLLCDHKAFEKNIRISRQNTTGSGNLKVKSDCMIVYYDC